MQSEIFQAFICYKCDDYGSQLMKTPNSKLEYFMKSIKKKDFEYRNVGPLKRIIMHMYSVLGLGLLHELQPQSDATSNIFKSFEFHLNSIL